MKFVRTVVLSFMALLAATAVLAQAVMPTATKEPDLVGTSWLLTATSGQDHQTLVLPGRGITLRFDGEQRMGGNGGCNGYGGTYALGDAGEMTFSEVVSTLMACEDTAITTQESIYLGALSGVTHYELTETQLTLRVGDVENLHFVRADQDPLAGTSWLQVSELPRSEDETDTLPPITLTFDAEGQAGGHGGCNSYSAAYMLDGTNITFRDMTSTEMACDEGHIMEREQAFLAALGSATQYGLTDQRLYIRPESGQRLAFARVDVATLTASRLSGSAYTEVELTGSGFAPNSEIVIGFGPADGDVYEPIGEAVSDADGAFTVTVTVPPAAHPDVDYVFMAAVPGTARTLSEPFDVTDDA